MSTITTSIAPVWGLTLADWAAGLPAVGLDQLNERAALQTRIDRKYVLTVDQAAAVLSGAKLDLRVLQIDALRSFTYESVYFDTEDFLGYRLAATRRRRRFKVRTRSYLDAGQCWLEVKTRGPRGATVKTRQPHPLTDRYMLEGAHDFVDGTLADHGICPCAASLQPVMFGTYRRTTLLVEECDSRLTVDTDLTWRCSAGTARAPFLAVVETKSAGGASPVDRLLWAHGVRPTRISKYATGLAALRPDLPNAPWRRTLRRHFAIP
ncbi:MAG: polyphosphate polymerase domain-containing protein [Kineosporiaceae bacterium]